jgi:D-lactate dehydrogenase (cytochrome)
MAATNKFGMSARKYPEQDSLFLKFQGPSQSAIEETARITKTIAEKHGGTGFSLASSEKEADDLWKDRKVNH